MAQNSQRLPPKESAVFKTVVKMYETKQYKKGLKQAEVVLKKYPNHGETLSMKGLILNCLNKKEEGYHFVRLGLKNDMTSHVCWHVYGLLYRSDKNYNEAIKCYRNALKHDPDNLQILRDLSLLQIQMRDLEGYRATRMDLLKTRPTQRPSWIGLAMAYHLMDAHERALGVLDAFEETLKKGTRDDSISGKYETSEMAAYKISIVAESGDHERALKLLEENEKSIVDKEAFKELKAETLAKLGRVDEAEEVYRGLLKNNNDCRAYYLAMEKLKDGSDLVEMYTSFRKEFPRAHFPRRRILDVTTGDAFRVHADDFLQNFLRKGAPSLFSMLMPLYADRAKAAIIESLVEGYYQEYLKTGRFTDGEDAPVEAPSARLWLEFFLSKHYDRVGNVDKALELVNTALGHTPTCIELYVHKAKIYKHAGDAKTAADLLNEARELDTADRYLNSKCVKYMLRADRLAEAEETVGLFTREGQDQVDNLQEMQCMWFEQCSGDSFLKQGKMGPALKRYHQVEKHFADITDDQFDFHTYCMRKMTLRAYVRLLRLEDKLRGHKFYKRAAHSAIQCYLRLADAPSAQVGSDQAGGESSQETAGLSEKELKKLRSKQRREQARAAATKEEPKQKVEEAKKGKKAQDTDPDGEQLASVADPLGEAIKFLTPLLSLAKDDVDTHLAAARIYMRKKKYLLVLRALKAAKAIDPANAQLHRLIVSFSVAVSKAHLNAHVRRVVDEELMGLMDTRSAADFNSSFLSTVDSVPDLIEALLARYELDANTAEDAAKWLTGTVERDVLRAGEAQAAYIAIRDGLKLPAKAAEYKAACGKKLPNAVWCRE